MERILFDRSARRRPTNVSVNSDLMNKAKERGVNVSALLEAALIAELQRRVREEWLEENRVAIEHYNQTTKNLGLFSDGLRTF